MIHLAIKNSYRLERYINPDTPSGNNIHLVITKPRTSINNIYEFVKPIYESIPKYYLQTQPKELPITFVKGSTAARGLGVSDIFIGMNPIIIQHLQKFSSQFINFDGVKKNGFKLITDEHKKNMSYVRNNVYRSEFSAIYILKTRDMATYEILKKLSTNQHLLPCIDDVYRICSFLRILIKQNNTETFVNPRVIPEV